MSDENLPGDDDLGNLGVAHVAQMWARAAAAKAGSGQPARTSKEIEHDRLVIDGLGLGLEPTMSHLWRHAESLTHFESWILTEKGGSLDPARVRRINGLILGKPYDEDTAGRLALIDAAPPVLDDADLRFWTENGYVVVHDAIGADHCRDAESAVWDYLSSAPDDPSSWYSQHLNGIMVQLFQHPALEVARRSPRIHKAFAQLWGTADLLITTDRCGFNPPERDGWRFPGPRLHWDVSLTPPVRLDTQGILYLSNTAADQGALTCVPGFHRRIEEWLAIDPGRQDQNSQDLSGFEATPIAGRAGDLVIWDGALPHGSSPNTAALPRIVQYLKMAPPFPGRFAERATAHRR